MNRSVNIFVNLFVDVCSDMIVICREPYENNFVNLSVYLFMEPLASPVANPLTFFVGDSLCENSTVSPSTNAPNLLPRWHGLFQHF